MVYEIQHYNNQNLDNARNTNFLGYEVWSWHKCYHSSIALATKGIKALSSKIIIIIYLALYSTQSKVIYISLQLIGK